MSNSLSDRYTIVYQFSKPFLHSISFKFPFSKELEIGLMTDEPFKINEQLATMWDESN